MTNKNDLKCFFCKTKFLTIDDAKKCEEKCSKIEYFVNSNLLKLKQYHNTKYIATHESLCKSNLEKKFLLACKKNKIKVLYEAFTFPLTIDFHPATYTPDFYLPEYDVFIELKGLSQYTTPTNFRESILKFQKFSNNYKIIFLYGIEYYCDFTINKHIFLKDFIIKTLENYNEYIIKYQHPDFYQEAYAELKLLKVLYDIGALNEISKYDNAINKLCKNIEKIEDKNFSDEIQYSEF